MDMLLIGIFIGAFVGFAMGFLQKQSIVLQTAPEEDLVREVKVRRYARKLADQVSAEVEEELRDPAPVSPTQKD